jgi:hypothetical protein
MRRDKLFLLRADFHDPAYPGQRFYCWHCALLEGVLASFPRLTSLLDVERVAWPKPRQAVVDVLGPTNQSLPLLLLADHAAVDFAMQSFQRRRFVQGKDAILAALSSRYAIPNPHP